MASAAATASPGAKPIEVSDKAEKASSTTVSEDKSDASASTKPLTSDAPAPVASEEATSASLSIESVKEEPATTSVTVEDGVPENEQKDTDSEVKEPAAQHPKNPKKLSEAEEADMLATGAQLEPLPAKDQDQEDDQAEAEQSAALSSAMLNLFDGLSDMNEFDAEFQSAVPTPRAGASLSKGNLGGSSLLKKL